jgi:hypothetical protein
MFQQIVLINKSNGEAFASGNQAYLSTYKNISSLFDAIHEPKNNDTNPNFKGWSSKVLTINELDYQIVTGMGEKSTKDSAKHYMLIKGLQKISTNLTQAANL